MGRFSKAAQTRAAAQTVHYSGVRFRLFDGRYGARPPAELERVSRIARRGGGETYSQPRIVSLESSDKWRDNTIAKLAAAGLSDFSEIAVSMVTIAEYRGQLCHFYDTLPDIVPDFVYLDGPDPATVQGSINGM